MLVTVVCFSTIVTGYVNMSRVCCVVHSPALSSVASVMWFAAGDSEFERMVIFGLLYLQVLVPRQFAHISHSVNME